MTISFSKLESYGRLGNQMFEVMSTIGIAERYGAQASFPKWDYEKYFVTPLPHGPMQPVRVYEKHYHYYDWMLTGDCDLVGYLQSERYFPKENRLVFKPEFLREVKNKVPNLWEKETVFVHIRRGDYVGCDEKLLLPISYFIETLLTYFPEDKNIIFASDEIEYVKAHCAGIKNAYFIETLSDIETIALATFCDHFILSNSSFSWWAAWLGEKKHSKIVHPGRMFIGKAADKWDIKDYYPKRWINGHK